MANLALFCSAIGILVSLFEAIFGKWTSPMITLLISMFADFITGIIVGAVFNNSPKSKSGALESRVGWKSLCRKSMILVFVLIGYRLDLAVGTAYIRDAVCIAFTTNEILSVVENAGLMGIPIPKVVINALEILKSRNDKNGK